MSALEAKETYEETTTDDNNISNGAGGNDSNEMVTVTTDDDDDDELFELDIALLRDADDDQHRRRSHGVDDGHALLANCLLPVSSVSKAVPVPASSILSSCAPLSGYNKSRRFFFAAGGSSRRLGRAGNGSSSSARFCLSSRGIDAMRNFQRY